MSFGSNWLSDQDHQLIVLIVYEWLCTFKLGSCDCKPFDQSGLYDLSPMIFLSITNSNHMQMWNSSSLQLDGTWNYSNPCQNIFRILLYDKRVINQQKCNFDMMITTWDKIHAIQLKKASLNTNSVTRAPLLLLRRWVALSFKVCLS